MTCENCRFWESEHKYMFCKNPKSVYFLQTRKPEFSCQRWEEEQKCKTCFYWQKEPYNSGMVCVNSESEHVADWTEAEQGCEEWEKKKGTIR